MITINTNTSRSLHQNRFSTCNIQIKLFDPVVIFRGNVNDSVGSLLRGEITLTLNKPTEITCIELKFSGKTKTFCPTDKFQIISQNITFLSHSTPPTLSPIELLFSSQIKEKYSTTFSSGTYTFPFEIHLPGSLPESITTGFGSVQYKLKFTVDYFTTFYLKTLSSIRKVEIARIVLPYYIIFSGIELSRSFKQILDYQLSIPKKSFFLNESIPINLKIFPLIKKLKLHSIEIILIQKVTCMNKSEFIQYSGNNTFQINENEREETDFENSFYEKAMKLDLPQCNNIILYHDIETSLIKIKHELKFCLLLSIPNDNNRKKNRVKSKLCFDVGINLLSCSVKSDVISLPKYDDVSSYCPCHPEYQRIARFVLGDSFNSREDGRCNDLSCNFSGSKLPLYSK